jgi:hypothetical protein
MSWSPEEIETVWQRGLEVFNYDRALWRKDECGAWIHRTDYGRRDSQYGWEIGPITSQEPGGTDALSNLRPLHWQNNALESDGRLKCAVKASGNENIAAS